MKVRILINHNYLRRRQYWLAKGGYKDLPKADIATFLWMIANYQAAAQLRTPSENPEERTLIIDGDALSFPDNSMNRGMLAISREAKDLGVDPGIFMERFMGQVEITKWRSV